VLRTDAEEKLIGMLARGTSIKTHLEGSAAVDDTTSMDCLGDSDTLGGVAFWSEESDCLRRMIDFLCQAVFNLSKARPKLTRRGGCSSDMIEAKKWYEASG
jgi:hypothetical protein